MPNTISPNMSLILPTVGQEPGPNWALDLNNSLSLVDQHNHAPGSGVQITPAGMDINVDLSFGSNNATSLRSVRMDSQLAPLALGADINCIYVSNGNLYYNDNLGNQVQITVAGAVNGTPGSIGNLIAPAAVTYVPGTQTFVFESNQGNATPAAIDCGPLLIRNIAASSNYIQIQPPAVLPGNYSITLPASLPVSQQFLSINNLGNVISVAADNSTVEISTNVLQVKNSGITLAKMAANSVDTTQLVNASVTNAKMANDSVATVNIINGAVTEPKIGALPSLTLPVTGIGPFVLGSFAFVNIVSGTITVTAARKLIINCQHTQNNWGFNNNGGPSASPQELRILITSPTYGTTYQGFEATNAVYSFAGNQLNYDYSPQFTNIIDLPGAETYTIAIQWRVVVQGLIVSANNMDFRFQVVP